MTLFSRILSAFGVGGMANPEKGAQSSGPASRSTDAGIVVSDERAMQVSAVWACARIITQTVANLPLHFYERGEKGRKMVDDSQVARLFKRSPNNFMTPKQFRAAMTLQRVLWGNAYAHVTRVGGRPVQMVPLKPEAMTPYRLESGLQYHYNTGSGIKVFAPESIFHLKGFSTDGVVGLSTLAYARHILGTTVAADTYASKAFANGGMPVGQITFDKFLTDEQRAQAKILYDNLYAGVQRAGEPVIMEGGSKYEAIGIHPDDMQMLESRSFQLGEIARMFGVPSHMINDNEKTTSWGTGIEQQTIAFLQYTLKPYLEEWEDVISASLLNKSSDIYAEHNVEGLLRGDSAARSSFYSTMVQNGLMTRNEVRRTENLPEVEGGDDLTIQVNLAPVGDLPKVSGGNNAA
ncbi:MAG: phage portal protein [Gammaproteobacteria bacterium]|nr:MAG: phage portal protein [Gammaproteobacteria bacterium]